MTTPVAAPALVRLGRVDSTQTVAFALAADGAERTVDLVRTLVHL